MRIRPLELLKITQPMRTTYLTTISTQACYIIRIAKIIKSTKLTKLVISTNLTKLVKVIVTELVNYI
jgi:hypothetical protein